MPIRDILAKMRHDGCGGRAGKAELLTGIEGVSSRPVRRIVLREGRGPIVPHEGGWAKLPARDLYRLGRPASGGGTGGANNLLAVQSVASNDLA